MVFVHVVEATPKVKTEATDQLKHAHPGFTVKGADWAVVPVLSTRVRPRDVPD